MPRWVAPSWSHPRLFYGQPPSASLCQGPLRPHWAHQIMQDHCPTCRVPHKVTFTGPGDRDMKVCEHCSANQR